jgi:hypothetical protein
VERAIKNFWAWLGNPKNREIIDWIIKVLILLFLLKGDRLNYKLFGTGTYIPFFWKTF